MECEDLKVSDLITVALKTSPHSSQTQLKPEKNYFSTRNTTNTFCFGEFQFILYRDRFSF